MTDMVTQRKRPEAVPPEMAAYAIAELTTGRTYRAVQREIEEKWGRVLSLGTLGLLFSSNPDRLSKYHKDQMQAVLERNFRVSQLATEMIEDRLDQAKGSLSELNFITGTAEDKIIALARLAQDEKHSNILRNALRHALHIDPDERLLLAESVALP